MKEIILNVTNMSCNGCVKNITETMGSQVQNIEVSLEDNLAKITYDETKTNLEDILRYMDIIGHPSTIKD